MRVALRLWMALVLACSLFGLHGCATLQAGQTQALLANPPADLPPLKLLSATPFFPQTELQCGPAALATVMVAAGVATTPQALSSEVFLPGRGGSLQIDMLAAPRRHGVLSTRIQPDLSSLLRELAAGHPVVVLLNLGLSLYPVWHYAVVVGYDLPAGDVLMRSGSTELARWPLSTFEHTWSRSGQWAFVVLPPDQLPVAASEADVSEGRVNFERLASPEQAVRAYRVAWQRWPDSLVLGLGLGNALHAAGDSREAAQVLSQVALRHDSAAAWNNLATVRLKLGERAAALHAAEQALRRAQTQEPRWLEAARATLDEVRQALTTPGP